MRKYSFCQCTTSQLDELFGLRESFSNQHLDNWLAAETTITEIQKSYLEIHQNLLSRNRGAWNEQELALQFIGPIFSLVDFTEPYRFNLFAERRISAIVTSDGYDVELSGEPDGIIASGYREPQTPYFAFTEYKKQFDSSGDPVGQTLAAMLAGQTLNNNQAPVYGAYTVGGDWTFMVLDGKHYTVSRDYSALSDEIYDIFRILQSLKQIVLKLTESIPN